jgi:ABC-type antimicrobial peptide transport system permease subunit
VIINKALARRLFGDRDPLGQRIAWTGDVLRFVPISPDWRTVVGVVGDTRDQGPDVEPGPVMFQPFAQEEIFSGIFIVRARADAERLATSAVRAIREVDPQALVDKVQTLESVRDEGVAPRRVNAMLVTSFGALALLIAAVGIAGVLAFSVSARTAEIAIRMSLGATVRRVYAMVLGEGGALLGAGLAVGLVGALFAARLLRGLLFGITPHDPATLGAVALVLAGVGIAACWIPAARAARVDPAVALRAD